MSEEDEMAGPSSPSWADRLRQGFQDNMANFDPESCQGCKWVGAGGMFGAATYVSYVGYRRAQLSGKRWGFIPSAIAASVLFTLGAVRLTDYNPFSSSQKFGIDALNPLKDRLAKSQALAEIRQKLEQQVSQQQREDQQTEPGGTQARDSEGTRD